MKIDLQSEIKFIGMPDSPSAREVVGEYIAHLTKVSPKRRPFSITAYADHQPRPTREKSRSF